MGHFLCTHVCVCCCRLLEFCLYIQAITQIMLLYSSKSKTAQKASYIHILYTLICKINIDFPVLFLCVSMYVTKADSFQVHTKTQTYIYKIYLNCFANICSFEDRIIYKRDNCVPFHHQQQCARYTCEHEESVCMCVCSKRHLSSN